MKFIEKVRSIQKGNKELILGSWINTASPIVAEIMSNAGFDFLCIDAEHSAIDINTSLQLFQAIKAGNPACTPLVRMQGNNYADTKRYLDAGALGVIAPLVNSREEVEYLIKSVKYPPLGNRGVGYGRSHAYGFAFDQYMQDAEDNIFIAIQIEHIDAVNNFEEMAQVKGLDAIFVGPYDLTASMGITGQFDHPDYLKVLEKINSGCKKHNIIGGIHVVQPNPQEVLEKHSMGYNMIAYSLDITIIGSNCRNALNQINNSL
ncbi:HpcH/HpaI aldolase family protein [Roseimarinus sediminis]|uniref:HpcH/HpaI aldolase family protein n=1 Tax=Roseimarinus sediminis TaxID=1610899 RepID=UPI003D1DB5AC